MYSSIDVMIVGGLFWRDVGVPVLMLQARMNSSLGYGVVTLITYKIVSLKDSISQIQLLRNFHLYKLCTLLAQ